LERVVDHCLEKNPEERFQSARDLGFALEALSGLSSHPSDASSVAVASAPAATKRAWALAAVVVMCAAVALAVYYASRPASRQDVVRSTTPPPENAHFPAFNDMAVSPDGLRLVFVAISSSGATMLWLRPLGTFSVQPLAGTEGAFFPFWSPDSRFIGFFAGGKLKKIDVAGGPPQPLCDAANGRGGTWNRDGVIVFAPDAYSALYRAPQGAAAPPPLSQWTSPAGNMSPPSLVFCPTAATSSTAPELSLFIHGTRSAAFMRVRSIRTNTGWFCVPTLMRSTPPG